MIDKFLEYIQQEKRYSPNTITSYRKDLEDFLSFLMDREGLEDLQKAEKKMVRNFIVFLSEKGLTKRSINRKISTLKSFYAFLQRISLISVSPVEGLSTLKFYPEKQIPFSKEEMQDLSVILDSGEVELLDRLIIEVLYQTGMRRAELCNLLLENVHFYRNEITVIGKGNKQRIVPISPVLMQELKVYNDEYRKPNLDADLYFFVTPKGKKITEKFVYLLVTRYLSAVSSKRKRSPHILRHSFATHILNNGAEISKVKKMMGHASLSSTQVYTNADIEQLKNIFNKTHPRGNAKTQLSSDDEII
jgi:tyrosine recombinase xerC